MPSLTESPPVLKHSIVTEVPAGSRVTLECNSNDYNHNFLYWILGSSEVIGPGSPYDERKYKYEILSGKLYIDNVTPDEAGFYRCVSRQLDEGRLSVGEVEMIVKGAAFSTMDAVKLIAIVLSIIVLISCAVIYYRLRKEWNKYDGRAIVLVDDEEEEAEGDEIYNSTTIASTGPTPGPSQPAPSPSRNPSSEQLLYGIDNQGLDTDFNSVFENIQIKSPPSLI